MSATSHLKPRPLLPARTPRTPRLLPAAVVLALTAVIVTDLSSLYAGTQAHSLLDWEDGFAYASMDDWAAADARYQRAWTFQGQATIVCGIVFIAWFHQMYRNAVALAPDRLRTGTGWAIGAWFLPLINFWRPFRIALDMWGVYATATATATAPVSTGEPAKAAEPAKPAKAVFWPVGLWWGLFVTSAAFNQYTLSAYDRAEGIPDLRDAVVQLMVADVLDLAAAAAAIHFTVRLTAMYRRLTP
ncbi:DUF4328 domain-containing protein [Streptomyces sp. NPDC005533]|uniref:DUF4328 domain-containing protein n=1 Tax=Streptomyces sp. NPDC005533 TaxID=3364723 RepID=UPI003690B6F8